MNSETLLPQELSKPLDTIEALQQILLKADKPSQLFNEKILSFYEARQPIYHQPPTFIQLLADYNQYEGQSTLQTIKWNLDRCQRELQEVLDQIQQLREKALEQGSYYEDINGIKVISLQDDDKEQEIKLEKKKKDKESSLRNHYEQWVKLWDKIRMYEEKRLDRETPRKVQSVSLNLTPGQIAEFVNNKEE